MAATIQQTASAGKPVFYISDRPEAYEVWAEVSVEEARSLARVIAAHAAEHFPDVDFLIDGAWHHHQRGTEQIASYIEGNWQNWADEALTAH